MMRSFGQGRKRPAALLRRRSEDDRVADDADLALLPVDLDRVGAFVGGPGQEDLALAGGGLQVDRRGVLERLVVEAACLEPRRDAHRNAGPAGDAIERMPAVIEQNAAARELRIDAPVCDARRRDGGRRLGPERRPTDRADGADRALVDERRDLLADWRAKPIVNRMEDAPRARGGRREARSVVYAGDQGFLAQHMEPRVERASDDLRMVARRRADIDEIELFAHQEIVDRLEPPAVGARVEERLPPGRGGVGRSDDPDIVAGTPAGHVPIGRDIAEADEPAPQHWRPFSLWEKVSPKATDEGLAANCATSLRAPIHRADAHSPFPPREKGARAVRSAPLNPARTSVRSRRRTCRGCRRPAAPRPR